MKSRLEPEILRLHATGMKGVDIAERLGCTRACVSQALKRNGRGRPKNPDGVNTWRQAKAERSAAAKAAKAEKVYKSKTNPRHVSFTGENLGDPNRADKLLRRFSFQDLPSPDYVRSVAA